VRPEVFPMFSNMWLRRGLFPGGSFGCIFSWTDPTPAPQLYLQPRHGDVVETKRPLPSSRGRGHHAASATS
jgi:hypothetical protein